MKEIEQKAKSGWPGFRGLSEEDMASVLDEFALIPSLDLDKPSSYEQQSVETEVIIGEGRDVKFPLLLTHPLFVDACHLGRMNKSVRIALTYSALKAKIPINICEGMLPEEKKLGDRFQNNFISQWSPLRLGIDKKTLASQRAVVITLGDGYHVRTFPSADLEEVIQSKGGLLTQELLNPGHHLDLETEADLGKHVELLREATEYKIPIMIKIKASDVLNGTKSAIEAEADAVIIDTSMNPFSTLSTVSGTYGASIIGAIPPAQKAFKGANASKEGIKLLVTGGFRSGADIVKVLAMGVDAVGIAESTAVALGCDLCGECYKGICEKGMATRTNELRSRFKWKNAGKKLSNYINATKKEIEFFMNFLGINDVKKLDTSHITALTYDAAAISGIKLTGYDRELPMWFH
ncbi:MAG: alpha-hydroxy-acid oxidizing protein [Methanomassiliicoccales archaeon]|nr:MAG: alpha-hydroxy-acid oxidizing protein [Methanomassiliicoccales archaeon]